MATKRKVGSNGQQKASNAKSSEVAQRDKADDTGSHHAGDRPTLYLIDGHYAIFRSYHAPFRDLTSPTTGEPTKATYVFSQFLLSILEKRQPSHIAMVMEGGDKETFRSELDPDYKANREPPPDDFYVQRERIIEVVQRLGVPIVQADGYEADDVIATLATQYVAEDVDIVIVSRDKDLRQILRDGVRMYDPIKDEFITAGSIRENLGYGPELAIEVQSLCGDNTDNIPGVKGVGEKTAVKLLNKYGSAEAVVQAADEQSPKLAENLRAFVDQLPITRQLVTLRTDVAIDFPLKKAVNDKPRLAETDALFKELGFRTLRQQLRKVAPVYGIEMDEADDDDSEHGSPTSNASPSRGSRSIGSDEPVLSPIDRLPPPDRQTTAADGNYTLIDDEASLAKFAETLAGQKAFAFDTETTAFHCRDAQLVGIAISFEPMTGHYIAIACAGEATTAPPTLFDTNENDGGSAGLPLDVVQKHLGPIFADERVVKVAHNLKFDLLILRAAGLPVAEPTFDTMLASYLLDPARRHGLKEMGEDLLGHSSMTFKDLVGTGKKAVAITDVPLAEVAVYAGEDADITWRLYEKLQPALASEPSIATLEEALERPLLLILADMEWQGVAIDADNLALRSVEMGDKLAALTERIHAAAGEPFNINSTPQLREVLFDKLGFPVIKRVKTGASTDSSVLEELAFKAETGEIAIKVSGGGTEPGATPANLPQLILDYRELDKLKGTYVDPLGDYRAKATGRIHARFNQTVAETGRLSSSDPNLQNIPIRTDEGRRIREAFVPSQPGWRLISGDYSQIELRLLAHFSEDANLMKAFEEDVDIHAFVAAQVFGVGVNDVSREQRGKAKAVNYGIAYGQTAWGLARTLKIPQKEASAFIRDYRKRFNGIVRFLDDCVQVAEQQGFVETIMGRRRYIRGIHDRSPGVRAQAHRLAINTVIQGSAADLIKKAMLDVAAELARPRDDGQPRAVMLIQVHDELVFEAPESTADAEMETLRQLMEKAIELKVPVTVDLGSGPNWLACK